VNTSTRRTRSRPPGELFYLAGGLAALATVTALYGLWLGLRNPTVVGLSYLMIVLLVAAGSTLRVAFGTSVIAVLALNYFFLPPVRTFVLEDPENWVALVVFLVVSIVGSRVSVMARERAALVEERQEADRMRQSAELKSALLSSLGHDLKTPLTAIMVATDNLRANWASDEERREQLDVVASEVARLNRLFQNIVDMARIETGAVVPAPEWVHLVDIVDASLQRAAQALAKHPLDLQLDVAGAVQVDPRLTAAALAHVLENAGQYAPPGTPITVSGRFDGVELSLAVRDRGHGIAQEDLQYLFEHFYRGSGAGRRSFGTGMGLAIARGLLVAQGGQIRAENHPDGGARFTMTIPSAFRAEPSADAEVP
jgi:K+-sensing histidine kinase KdpD